MVVAWRSGVGNVPAALFGLLLLQLLNCDGSEIFCWYAE